MESCEKYKNRGGKETEKEISKLFVSIPDWEEKSKPDFFPAKQKHGVLGSQKVVGQSPQAGTAFFQGVRQNWGAVGLTHPTRRCRDSTTLSLWALALTQSSRTPVKTSGCGPILTCPCDLRLGKSIAGLCDPLQVSGHTNPAVPATLKQEGHSRRSW